MKLSVFMKIKHKSKRSARDLQERLEIKYYARLRTFSIFDRKMMSEANSLAEAVRLLDQKVHDLIERLSFQRSENEKLKRRVVETEQAKMILEEEVGVLNRKLSERRDHFSRLGSVQQNDEIGQQLDQLIKELQECIDEIN